MNRMNPYEILGIPEFSNTDIVNAKFLEILEKYEQLTKLNKKQIKFLEDVRDAHETLTDEFKKSAIDSQLKINRSNNHGYRTEIDSNQIAQEKDDIDDSIEREFSTEKTISIDKKNKKGFLPTFVFIVAALIGGSILYSKINQPESTPTANTKQETAPEPQPTQPLLITDNINQIKDNILYPDANYLNSESLLYAPDGTVFPLNATVLPSMPITGDGQSTFLVQNTKASAIFGKVIVKFSQESTPIVLRYFYIPPKETLYLFNMPSGNYQIQVMTLSKPQAFVSPLFNIPLGANSTITQIVDWKFPFQASKLF